MELRLQLDARTTRDLDAVFLGAFDGWLDALEVAPAEVDQVLDIDEVDPFDLTQFGLPAADRVPIVGLPYLIAQKLHACTESLDGRDNPRVRDLIDLQLIQPLLDDADLPRVRQACREIFTARDTHP